MILIIGVAIIFFGCSENNSLIPDLNQNDEVTNSLKSKKIPTHFACTCTPLLLPDGDDRNAWKDVTDDDRVTGVSIWFTDEVVEIDEITFELRGTAELFVGAKVVGDEYDGKWEITWKGTQTLTSPGGSTFRIVVHAVGTGTEGDVLGLTAKWKYTMDFDGTPETLKYVIKGKITEVCKK